MVDYSKWDDIDVSDDDKEEAPHSLGDPHTHHCRRLPPEGYVNPSGCQCGMYHHTDAPEGLCHNYTCWHEKDQDGGSELWEALEADEEGAEGPGGDEASSSNKKKKNNAAGGMSGGFLGGRGGVFGGAASSGGGAPSSSGRVSLGAGLVTPHPSDDVSMLPGVFYENPNEFTPRVDGEGNTSVWGLGHGSEEFGKVFTHVMRKMNSQFLYSSEPSPEEQFVRLVMAKTERRLINELREATPFFTRDFVLRCDLVGTGVWRQWRCSGGVSLHALQDKILAPAMGWCRNFHAYYFVDQKDGAAFAPKDSGSIDMMHKDLNGLYDYMDDTIIKLAQVVREEGQKIVFVYDLGDNFRHQITVVSVLDAGESTGKVEVLDGACACPPENSHGNINYVRDIAEPLRAGASHPKFAEAMEAGNTAINQSKGQWRPFHPDDFDLVECNTRVSDAIHSTASKHQAPKNFVSRNMMEGRTNSGGDFPGFGPPVMEEGAPSNARDHRDVALCHSCGSPQELHLCNGCKLVRYCSRGCQLGDWERHKPVCKASQAGKKKEKEKKGKKGGKKDKGKEKQHTEEELRAMGVKDLKAVLAARGVDCSKAVEKGDLVHLALSLGK